MLVTVSKHFDVSEAIVARALLDQHGIPAFLFDHRLAGVNWLYLFALGGVRLMVPERDAETACRLLADLSEKIDVPEDEHCPACGSDEFFRPASWALLIMVWPLLLPLLFLSRRHRCRSCHHRWRGDTGFLI